MFKTNKDHFFFLHFINLCVFWVWFVFYIYVSVNLFYYYFIFSFFMTIVHNIVSNSQDNIYNISSVLKKLHIIVNVLYLTCGFINYCCVNCKWHIARGIWILSTKYDNQIDTTL